MRRSSLDGEPYLEMSSMGLSTLVENYHALSAQAIVIQCSGASSQKHYNLSRKITTEEKYNDIEIVIMLPLDEVGIEACRKIKRYNKKIPILLDKIMSKDELEFAKILGCEYVIWQENKLLIIKEEKY